MFEYTTPEKAGISSENVLRFIKTLDSHNLSTHSFIMARGNKIFAEGYYAPFNKDFRHRMYSVSKSFIAMAVGFLIQDGLISLDDKLIDYFPEYTQGNPAINDNMRNTTLRHMITMQTCHYYTPPWICGGESDRASLYFRNSADRVPGTVFRYDSHGSSMLSTIVERITGKPFLEYLKEKVLLDIGFTPDAVCVQAPGGHSFADSGILCTSMDLLRFAKFVMDKGEYNGKQYLNKEFIEEATKKQVATSLSGIPTYGSYGYGFLIWKAPDDGFAFVGMGDQFAICDPKRDFIFIINSDNQGFGDFSRTIIYESLYDIIVHNLGEPLPENKEAEGELENYIKNLKLFALNENTGNTELKDRINGRRYVLEPNKMGIEYVKFDFEGNKGILSYKNEQGKKEIPFGIGYNEFSMFPQEDYPDMTAAVPEKGNMYKCAASADFPDRQKLRIKVQIIDKYFGNLNMNFGFSGDKVGIFMTKTAEAFLDEYEGYANGSLCEGID